MKNERTKPKCCAWTAAGIGLALLALTGQARADDWSFHLGFGSDYPFEARQVPVIHHRPDYDHVTRQIWVEPIYEERTVRVDVPAVFEERVVPIRDRFGRIRGHRTVRECVREARIEYRTERVLVRDGYYKTVTLEVPVERTVKKVVRVGAPGFHVGFTRYDRDRHHNRPQRSVRFGHRY